MADEKLHLDHPDEEPPPYHHVAETETHTMHASAAEEKAASTRTEEFYADPAPPYVGPSKAAPLSYSFRLHRAFPSSTWTLTIVPQKPNVDGYWWQLDCTLNHKATVTQHLSPPPTELNGLASTPSRAAATIEFPRAKWSDPKIKFYPHEAEIERKGARHVSPTDRLMQCSGFFTTSYALDLPALNSARVTWKIPNDKDAAQALKLEALRATSKSFVPADEKTPLTVKSATGSESVTWSPYPTQYLIEETTGRVIASYKRSAPWAKTAGMLTIAQDPDLVTDHVVEDIIISCAVMAGMQYQMGLFSSLVESGINSVAAGKGKGRALE